MAVLIDFPEVKYAYDASSAYFRPFCPFFCGYFDAMKWLWELFPCLWAKTVVCKLPIQFYYSEVCDNFRMPHRSNGGTVVVCTSIMKYDIQGSLRLNVIFMFNNNSLDLPCPKTYKNRSVAGNARWILSAQKSPLKRLGKSYSNFSLL